MSPVEEGCLALDAPAKINLFLHVTGRRDDGYHLLESVVAFAGVGDRLRADPSDDLSVELDGEFGVDLSGDSSDNLVLRAAQRLQAACGIRAGARLRLTKSLPVASGIGGGSADAAAALRLLARLWKLPQAGEALHEALHDVAAGLGADMPVCLLSAPARFSGIGDVVEPVRPFPACGVVLANAREPVETPAVFAARQGLPFSPAGGWRDPDGFDDLVAMLNERANDLLEAALTVSPVIGDVLAEISSSPDCRLSRLSGSGGTCFGLYADAAAAVRAAKVVAAQQPGWWVVATAFRDTAPAIEAC